MHLYRFYPQSLHWWSLTSSWSSWSLSTELLSCKFSTLVSYMRISESIKHRSCSRVDDFNKTLFDSRTLNTFFVNCELPVRKASRFGFGVGDESLSGRPKALPEPWVVEAGVGLLRELDGVRGVGEPNGLRGNWGFEWSSARGIPLSGRKAAMQWLVKSLA